MVYFCFRVAGIGSMVSEYTRESVKDFWVRFGPEVQIYGICGLGLENVYRTRQLADNRSGRIKSTYKTRTEVQTHKNISESKFILSSKVGTKSWIRLSLNFVR